MFIVFVLAGFAALVLAHTAPAPFLLEAMARDSAVWRMPRETPPTVYLTFDDGPNPTTTPDLLDVLARERAPATFFLIDRHVTEETAPIVRRMFAEGHAVGLHSATRREMLRSPREFGQMLTRAADRIETLSGSRPCRAFRPHAGWRSGEMYTGVRENGYVLVGWGWMLWDWNWFRARTPDSIVARLAKRVEAGDIMVMHDGDEKAPRKDQRQTVLAAARLIPGLRARGFSFGTVCRNGG
ncbi:MAG: polysaccharide deacetylase family protein [Acidobacteria bacterium]|nr:polysaccharide deacetylase family protein [Acidobacteriota bacterium]